MQALIIVDRLSFVFLVVKKTRTISGLDPLVLFYLMEDVVVQFPEQTCLLLME